jgi:hypothetical protein
VIDSTEYIPEEYLYRAYDPWFGKNLTYRILFMTGLTPVSLNTWATTLLNTKNNYYKTLTLGDLKVARALDDNFNVIYEVIYADVIDTAVNAQGLSASREVTSAGSGVTVFPNSFENSAAAIGDDLGFSTRSVLPRWMSSKQVDGSVPGFRRVMVLAYLKPGRGAEVLFRLRDIKSQLVNATFSYSGYNLDNYLSSRWLATSSFPSSSFISANGNITANTLSNVVTGVNKITPLTGTGTVRGVNISNDPTQSLFVLALVGTGTNFANRVHPGDTLTWSDGTTVTTIGVIKSVRSNTLVTFEENPNTSLAGVGNLSCIESTNFINEVTVGDVIRANNTVIGTVANIVSANSLILTTNAQANITNFEFEHTRRDSYNVPLTSDKYITFANIGVLS